MTTEVDFGDFKAVAPELHRPRPAQPRSRKVGEVRAARRVLVTLLVVGIWMVVFPVPNASAGAELDVGMPIDIGEHRCSLGFFGFNSRGDRLAVTAVHCSDQIPDQPVYADNGVQIGQVVAWKPDVEDGDRKLVDSRGYTVFLVYNRFSLDPFFTHESTLSKTVTMCRNTVNVRAKRMVT